MLLYLFTKLNKVVKLGSLVLVSVPIGNTDDITLRALNCLKTGKHLLAEDTRVLKHLLNCLDISLKDKHIIAFHDHTDSSKYQSLLDILEEDDLYLVSDAGSPMISDPAFPLIKYAIENGKTIESTPGVSSVVVALELSGLPPNPFHFYGFLPREREKRKKYLQDLGGQNGTHIFFEGPSRVLGTLEQLSTLFSDCEISVCRELTKKFQTITRFVGRDFASVKDQIIEKGEFVILFNVPRIVSNSSSVEIKSLAQEVLDSNGKTKKLAKLLAEILNLNSKDLYTKLSQ